MAACTQLRLASVLVGDLRRPWHKRPEPGQVLSPTGSGWDFAVSARSWELPAGTAKSTRPGPSQGVEEPAQDPAADLPQKRQQAHHAQQGDNKIHELQAC